jgi:hypothetical protein
MLQHRRGYYRRCTSRKLLAAICVPVCLTMLAFAEPLSGMHKETQVQGLPFHLSRSAVFKHRTSHVTCHTLHVTRRTSHVTHHTSHVTHHASYVTRHTSHVTRHTSHITRHTSHVTHYTSRVTLYMSHVTRHTSHVTHHASYVTRHTSHVTRHTSHVTRNTSHVTRHTSHVAPGGKALQLVAEAPALHPPNAHSGLAVAVAHAPSARMTQRSSIRVPSGRAVV